MSKRIYNRGYHFEHLPVPNRPRSIFDLSHKIFFSFNTGDLVPVLSEEVLPGDTWKIKSSKVLRLTTLIDPIMSSMFAQMFFFFVPRRIVFDDWKHFMGENNDDPWTSPTTYTIPQVTSPVNGWYVGTIADYMDVPVGISNLSIDACYFRGYCAIVNEYFRDQNYNRALQYSKDMVDIQGSNGDDEVIDCVKGGFPFVVNKLHDKFTSLSPEPQKGPAVTIPLGTEAPLFIRGNAYDQRFLPSGEFNNVPLRFATNNSVTTGLSAIGVDNTTSVDLPNLLKSKASTASYGSVTGASASALQGTNQYADLSSASAASVESLREAFAVQDFLTLDAIYGTRYQEFILSHFGVYSSDKTQNIPLFLGTHRFDIQVNQVLQTSETSDNSPLGDTGAYSLTMDYSYDFTATFEEHGILFGLLCVRYPHIYSQGLPKKFSHQDKLDFFDPQFEHFGQQPVYNKEIYAQGTNVDDEVLGYAEYGIEYKYLSDRVRGQMRPTVQNPDGTRGTLPGGRETLDTWHLGDYFASLPTLGTDFLKENKRNVDRVIRVNSDVSHQFVANFYFNIKTARTMKTYSYPQGLNL